MARSEIFENYIKIALEKGIVKNAEETNPRYDSKSVKDIANLYNVKPEQSEDMKYEKNIIEDAHPERVVFFRSNDRVNSLVENVNERQNIIINILRKMPNGNLLQKRYAASELAMALVRTANDLDLQNKDELRILADTCSEQLIKEAQALEDAKDWVREKAHDLWDVGGGALVGGLGGALLGGLIAGPGGAAMGASLGAGAAGLLSAVFKTGPIAKNVSINAEIARNQLGDLLKQFPSDPILANLNVALVHIEGTAAEYSKVVDQMHMPGAGASAKQSAASLASAYMDELVNLNKTLGLFLAGAQSGKYEAKESDWWAKITTPITSIFGSEVHDAVEAVKSLQITINEAEQGINAIKAELAGVVSAPTAAANQAPAANPNMPMSYQPGITSDQLKEYQDALEQSEKGLLGK